MKSILLAYDGTEPAKRALEQAAELARVLPAMVSVISVVPIRPGPGSSDPSDDREVHDRELLEARTLMRERGVEVRLLEPAGDPARVIEHVAAEGSYDMIVLGSRGLPTVGRMVEGSVSEHVAAHSHQTVVVVH